MQRFTPHLFPRSFRLALLGLLAIVLVACQQRGGGQEDGGEGSQSGECSDAADNDRDGLFDCEDPGCSADPACLGGLEDDDDSGSGGDDDDSGSGDDDTEDCITTWENTGGPFALSWCTACHSIYLEEQDRQGAPLEVNLNTREDFLVHSESILKIALSEDPDSREMPPSGVPSEEEIDRVRAWMNCGCP